MMQSSKYQDAGQSVPFSKPAPLRKHRTTLEVLAPATTTSPSDPLRDSNRANPSQHHAASCMIQHTANQSVLRSKPSPLLRQKTAPDTMGPNWRTKTAVVQPSKASELQRQKSSLMDRFTQSRDSTSDALLSVSRSTHSRDSLPLSDSVVVHRHISFKKCKSSILQSLTAHSEFCQLPQELFVQPESLTVALNDPETLVLGEGGQGKILKSHLNGETVAVKLSHKSDVLREFLLTHQLRHPCIIRPIAYTVALQDSNATAFNWDTDSSSDDDDEDSDSDSDDEDGSSLVTFMAVYEYCPNGDLAAWLTKFPEMTRDETYMSQIFGNVLDALAHIHQNGYLHTDIKPENILVAEDGSVRLADFGMCQKFSDRMTAQGTPSYLPPEMVAAWHTHHEAHRYTAAADLFSFGVLLVNTITGKYPFHRITAKLRRGISFTTKELQETFVVSQSRFRELAMLSHRFAVLAQLCLRIEPSERTDAVFLRKILNQR